MASARFKLLKIVGHRCNFAEVEVHLLPATTPPWVRLSHAIPQESGWGGEFAISGVHRALKAFDPRGTASASIEDLRVTIADSNPHIIATAAYIATARAFGTEVPLEQFIQNDRIVFPGIAD